MFERFSSAARWSIIRAQEEAAKLGATSVGPEHLLLGIATLTDSGASVVLAEAGITPDGVRQAIETADAEALATIGISLDVVRKKVQQTMGSNGWSHPLSDGELPFAEAGKDALKATLDEARRLRHRVIRAEHILLGWSDAMARLMVSRAGWAHLPWRCVNRILSKLGVTKEVRS
jgi:ATP-dependent Clp protease ATP-binding subunit ClpA